VTERASSLARVQPLLADLDPAAQRLALLMCYYYAIPQDSGFLRENQEIIDRTVRAKRALRKLRTGLSRVRNEIENTLGDPMSAWSESIRAAHIPFNEPVMLPMAGESGVLNYFKWSRLPDPAEQLDTFVALWPKIEEFAAAEWKYLESRDFPRGSLARRHSRHFWRHGRFEYTLRKLFERFSKTKMHVREIEERIYKIQHELDHGARSADEHGGIPAVREAIRRVRNNARLKTECDDFLKSRLPHSVR
jgi:hypothetical protein